MDDINTDAARVRELRGEADQPGPVPGMGWFVTRRDPHGNESGLWQTDPSARQQRGRPRCSLSPRFKPGANKQVKRQAWSTWQQSHSFLATSGPVIRSSSGKVAAITASDAASPARTMV